MSAISDQMKKGSFDPAEVELIKMTNMYMNTLRMAGIVPEWVSFMQTQPYRDFLRQNSSDRLRRFNAIWNLLFHVMRDENDVMSVAYGIAYRVKRQSELRYSKSVDIHPELYDLPREHQLKIEDAVKTYFTDIDR